MRTLRALAVLVACGSAVAQDDPVRSEIARGAFRAALTAAESLTDDLARSRGIVEARYHAGDLPGALLAARDGLARHADDRWLAWRRAELGVALRSELDARAGVEALRRSVASAPPTESDFWRAQIDANAAGLSDLERGLEASGSARTRALACSALVLAGAITLAAFLARRDRPARDARA